MIDSACPETDFTPRQREVLTVVLDLMVEAGDGFSMAEVARRASCSKETLYNWFGDRDGLLTATVKWQAAKVKMPELSRSEASRTRFRETLAAFAENWLTVLAGDISVALNQLAIAHAGAGKGRLGEIVLTNGPEAMARRLAPILDLGRETGLLALAPGERESRAAFRCFFGLVIGDSQIRALLGDLRRPTGDDIRQEAVLAADRFLALYGAAPLHPTHSTHP